MLASALARRRICCTILPFWSMTNHLRSVLANSIKCNNCNGSVCQAYGLLRYFPLSHYELHKHSHTHTHSPNALSWWTTSNGCTKVWTNRYTFGCFTGTLTNCTNYVPFLITQKFFYASSLHYLLSNEEFSGSSKLLMKFYTKSRRALSRPNNDKFYPFS